MKLAAVALIVSAASLVSVAAVRAETQLNIKDPTTLTVPVPCANGGAGEDINVSGDLHILFTFTINNNRASGKMQYQPQGISGTGTVTGAKYQATGGTKDSFNVSLVNGQGVFRTVNNFRMVGQGPGNNFTVHENLTITFNANGTVTAAHDNFTADCK